MDRNSQPAALDQLDCYSLVIARRGSHTAYVEFFTHEVGYRVRQRHQLTTHRAYSLVVLVALAIAAPVWSQSRPSTPYPIHETPAGAVPSARESYTADHRFLIRLLSVPGAVHLQRYFTVRLAVYDGHDTQHRLSDVQLEVAAGMAHGMAEGFAHGMQSAPQVEMRDGVAIVSGLFFHMPGEWTMRVTVHHAGQEGTGSFLLPCCAQ